MLQCLPCQLLTAPGTTAVQEAGPYWEQHTSPSLCCQTPTQSLCDVQPVWGLQLGLPASWAARLAAACTLEIPAEGVMR